MEHSGRTLHLRPWFIGVIIICVVCVVGIGAVCVNYVDWDEYYDWYFNERPFYRTTDLADYGTYAGTAEDEFVQAFITSFFPVKIEDYFEDITYSYIAEGADTYGFEAYLEFKIKDKTAFDSYVANIQHEKEWQEFRFDPQFKECVIRNGLSLGSQRQDIAYSVSSASIKKILYNEEERIVVYWALGMYDGGFADTTDLGVFFKRFNIDPKLYEEDTYYPADEMFDPYD